MDRLLDNETLDLPCEACGHVTKKTIGWVRRHSEYTCTCGVAINLKADQFRRVMAEVDRRVAALSRQLKKL